MEREYISVTDTAKLIRLVLKESFPGVKFSVKSSKYAADVIYLCGKHNIDLEFLRELYRECEKLREIIESGSVQDLDDYLLREC